MGIVKGGRRPALPALAAGILVTLGLSLLATPAAAQTRMHGTCWITQIPVPEFDPWDPDGDPNTDDGHVRVCDPSHPDYDASFFSLNRLRAGTASSSRYEVEGDTDRYGPNTFSLSLSTYCEEAVTVAWKTMGGTATDGVDYHSVAGNTFVFPAGKVSAACAVTTMEDELDEPNEVFWVGTIHPDDLSSGLTTATGSCAPTATGIRPASASSTMTGSRTAWCATSGTRPRSRRRPISSTPRGWPSRPTR